MTFSDFLAIGAILISVFSLWYANRQTDAAESSARSARDAERRALKLERVMGFRWEIVPNGTDRYLIFNAGNRDAHDVEVDLPNFMSGTELRVQKMRPLERKEFIARVIPSFQSQAPVQLPREITIRWEDREEKTPLNRVHRTTVAEYQPT